MNLDLTKYSYKIRAKILSNYDNFDYVFLDWLKLNNIERKAIYIKTIFSKNNKFEISIANESKDLRNELEKNDEIILGCIKEQIIYKLKISNLSLKDPKLENIKIKKLIIDENFKYTENSHFKCDIEEILVIDVSLELCENYKNEDDRIKNLATEERINKFNEKGLDFIHWYKEKEKKCCYCGIEEKYLIEYFNNNNNIQYYRNDKDKARQRGKFLEIERIKTSDKSVNQYFPENTELACYICNNAKSDFLSAKNFKPIAKGINIFWNKLLNQQNNLSDEELFNSIVKFPDTDNIWNKE